ncbi:MAG: extracellular solute-binding protein [Acidisphaera sp.]|nr:extracellular solute-binding protein [Acidisphaera sp.]
MPKQLISAALLGLILLVGLAVPARAADPALIAAAEKEGSLVLYGCDPGQVPVYVEAFQKKYPKVKLTSYVAGCWQIYNRNATERQAGRQTADAFFATEDTMSKLDEEHLLGDYRSPELKDFPAYAQPAGKHYVRAKVLILGMSANRQFTKGMPLPHDWFDFADPPPAWHGQISFYDPRTSSAAFSLLAALHQDFGAEKTASIYKGLVASGAALAPTTPAGLQRVLSGEQPIMFYIVNNHYSGAVAEGAPLDFLVPTSGTIALPFDIADMANAPHPNAAHLFVDFMLSDVQTIIQHANEYALRNGSGAPKGMPDLNTIKILPFDVNAALQDQAKLLAWWQQVTGIN